MSRGSVKALARFAAFLMLVVLVCPDVPTPIYVAKGKSLPVAVPFGLPQQQIVFAPVFNPAVLHPAEAPVAQSSTGLILDLACQRLC